MNVYIQNQYLDKVKHSVSNVSVGFSDDLDKATDLAVFDLHHIPSVNQLAQFKEKVLIVDQEQIDFQTLKRINPRLVVKSNELNQLAHLIHNLSTRNSVSLFKQAQLLPVDESSQIESLQKELKEKSESLKYFVNEENLKKQKEKKLLYFLDFLNAEQDTPEFIENLCELLWMDLKKLGSFHMLGFIVTLSRQDNAFVLYDGKQAKFNYNIRFSGQDEKQYALQLADVLQRPIAATKFWTSEKNQLKSFLFLENRGALLSPENLDSYISERVDLMVLMIQRHISQLQTTYLLNKWNVFGKAYQQPMHVIDSEYTLVQSNYFDQTQPVKCFEKLAGRATPCENCPVSVQKNVNPVTIQGRKYKSYATKFSTDKDYFFVFYENQTEADLVKSNLIQNEKMNVIGQLANHLAHELNNPLTGLKLATEFILQQPQLETTVKNDFTEVLKGIDRCKNIITDLLEFSSDQSPVLTVTTLDEVIKKTMPLLKSITRTFNVFIDVKNVHVRMNAGHVQQVIFNLVKNSCQAMPSKGSIKIYDIDTPSHYDVIFEDNGGGLPESIKSHLFEPFATTKAIGEGTGLGLYISKSLVKRMHADLLYDANYKNGTRFILRFFK
ncbi:MAG: HAMP domain-containing sensor histidine kinase [Bdellovibrionota bacterium]